MKNRIDCYLCKQCNNKGKPSVMRFSSYCDTHYISLKPLTNSLLKRISERFAFILEIPKKYFNARYDEKNNKLNTKGFRKSWFKI